MKKFSILTLSLNVLMSMILVSDAWTQAPVDKPNVAASGAERQSAKAKLSGQRVLQLARQKLIEYQPFKAEILETVVIGPRKFQATGQYTQGQDLQLRLAFQVQVGETNGDLLEVCDGQVLSTRLTIGDDVRITRRDVREILNAAVAGNVPEIMLKAELGLGGLSGLLASLEANMDFDAAQSETIASTHFLVIEGKWNTAFLKKWQSKDSEGGPPRLPDYVPDRVRVYFDVNDFPRRILYLKQPKNNKIFRPMVTLDFNKVVLNASVPEEVFHFVAPDGVYPEDVTKQYLQQLLPAPSASDE